MNDKDRPRWTKIDREASLLIFAGVAVREVVFLGVLTGVLRSSLTFLLFCGVFLFVDDGEAGGSSLQVLLVFVGVTYWGSSFLFGVREDLLEGVSGLSTSAGDGFMSIEKVTINTNFSGWRKFAHRKSAYSKIAHREICPPEIFPPGNFPTGKFAHREIYPPEICPLGNLPAGIINKPDS